MVHEFFWVHTESLIWRSRLLKRRWNVWKLKLQRIIKTFLLRMATTKDVDSIVWFIKHRCMIGSLQESFYSQELGLMIILRRSIQRWRRARLILVQDLLNLVVQALLSAYHVLIWNDNLLWVSHWFDNCRHGLVIFQVQKSCLLHIGLIIVWLIVLDSSVKVEATELLLHLRLFLLRMRARMNEWVYRNGSQLWQWGR